MRAAHVLLAPLLVLAQPVSLCAQNIKLSSSLPDLEAAARKDSNDAQALYNVALGYWSKKRYDDAERSLRLAVTIEPRFAAGWLALGVLPYGRRPKLREQVSKGRVPDEWKPTLQDAERMTRKAFLIDPFVDLRILGAVEPPQPMSIGVVNGVLVVFTNPFAAFQQGRYEDAFRIFDRIVHPPTRSVPLDSIPAPLLWYHGLSAAQLRRYDDAIVDFQALLERAVSHERRDSLTIPIGTNDCRYVLALLEERVHQPLDAIRLYREALENDLGLYMAHVRLAKIYEAQQQWDSALVESQAAVMVNPEDASLMLDHGIILTEAGYLVAAEDTLRRAMEADPRDARVSYFLGVTQHAMNKTAAARATFERFLSLAPSRYQRQIRDAQERLATLH